MVTFPNGLAYRPGVKQHLVVSISDITARRWGFELTARTANNPKNMAGFLSPTDNRTQLMCSSADLVRQVNASVTCPANLPLAYIEHTLAGYNVLQANPGRFEFDWTPPVSDVGLITIYVAGMGADGNLGQGGDHTYTASYTLGIGTPPPGCTTANHNHGEEQHNRNSRHASPYRIRRFRRNVTLFLGNQRDTGSRNNPGCRRSARRSTDLRWTVLFHHYCRRRCGKPGVVADNSVNCPLPEHYPGRGATGYRWTAVQLYNDSRRNSNSWSMGG